MKWTRVLASAVLLALVACSGGGDSVTEPINEPPTITFTYRKIGVTKDVPVDLTVDVSDPNDDPLTITWQISRGSLTQQNPQRTEMRWDTPATVGTDTVRVQVTDGSLTRSVTAEIKVGTLFTSPVATSFVKANSPYIVRPASGNPRVTVQPGPSPVTIEAGVELLIDTQASFFDVLGTFEANGTADERIVIRPNDRTLVCSDAGWWDGVRAATEVGTSEDGFVDFEHVEIRGATNGVRLRDNASALLRECRIVCCSAAGVLMEGNGSLRAFDTEISNGVQDGIAIVAIASLPDSVRVSGCKLAINGNTGIRMDLQDTGNIALIIVEFNEIEFNGSHGISLANAVFPSIHCNAFRGNGDETVSNLFLQGGYPGGVNMPFLDATCNFWGSAANPDASIRDSLDSGTVGTRVDSDPWQTISPIPGSPPCICSP